MAEEVYILLGSNIGDRERFIDAAVDRMGFIEGLEIVAASSLYLSEAVGMDDNAPSFLNGVIKADYRYPPHELLRNLEKIESDLGRTDKGQSLPRTIDLDILLFGQKTVNTTNLIIPHPRMLKRPFALVPLLEIDPEISHPVTGRPISSYVSERSRAQVTLYRDHVARNL